MAKKGEGGGGMTNLRTIPILFLLICAIAVPIARTSAIFLPLLFPLISSPTKIDCAQNGVLCRAQYSASLGGRNEGLPDVSITTTLVGAEIQTTTVYITDEHGQTYIPFKTKEKYDITVVYNNVEKTVRLSYNGESILLISIDPKKPLIGDISFLHPQPSDKDKFLTIENLGWLSLGVVVSFILMILYHRLSGSVIRKSKSSLLLYLVLLNAVLIIPPSVFGASVGDLNTPSLDAPYDSPTSLINLEFLSPKQVMVMEHATEYHWLKLPGCRYILKPGHPSLPIKVTIIKINEGYNVSAIWAGVISTEKLEGKYKIMPAPKPVTLGEEETEKLSAPSPKIYGSDEMYPYTWFDYQVYHGIDPETLTTVNYLAVYFYPLRYIPIKGEIIRATKAELYVEYSGSAQGPKSPSTSLIIITSPLLEPQATLLSDWKNQIGISTSVVTTSWIYANYPGIDEPEKIRNYIKYGKASLGVKFVLIFGDADQVPVRYAWIPDSYDDSGDVDGSVVETDLYYADLDYTWDDNHDGKWGDIPNDQVDGIPDLYIGRLPVSNENDALTLINKIKNYEPAVHWFNRCLLMGGDPFTSAPGAEGEILKNYVKDNFIPPIFSYAKLYESLGNYTVNDARREIDKGYGIVNFDGHGNYNLWSFGGGGTYYSSDAMTQVNGNKTSAIFVMACLTSRFSDRDCIGEAFLLDPNGGAIAYYGASRVAWGYTGWSAPDGLAGEMDWRFFEAIYDSYDQPLDLSTGQIWGTALTKYTLNHPPDTYHSGYGYHDWKTIAEYGTLLGDPTVYLYAPLPQHDIAVTKLLLPSSAPPSETITISAQVENYGLSDEYGIEIQLLVNGDPFDTAYIAELPSMAGTTVNFTWTLLTCGIYNITVNAPLPLLGTNAANLAKDVIGAPYLNGGKGWKWNPANGWNWENGKFVDSIDIKNGYNYWNDTTQKVEFGKGLDCSGLVFWAYDKNWNKSECPYKYLENPEGYKGPIFYEGAHGQWNDEGRFEQISNEIPKVSDLKPGYLLFLNTPYKGFGIIDHVGMYVGDDNVIHSMWREGVVNDTLGDWLDRDTAGKKYRNYFVGYGRVKASIRDENPANNDVSKTVHIHSLYVDSVDAPRDILVGETFTLLVEVSNRGSFTISEACATLSLPSGLSTGDPLTKPINNGIITPGESGSVDWKVNADVEGEYTIVVNATTFDGGFDVGSTTVKVRGSCFIFTAAYGSPMASQVQLMRGFRDDVASQTFIGRGFFNVFNRVYFSFSPQLASFISSSEWIRGATRVFITPAVKVVCMMADAYSSMANVLGSELAMLIALFAIVTLSSIIYFAPIVMLFFYIRKRHTKRRLGRVKIG